MNLSSAMKRAVFFVAFTAFFTSLPLVALQPYPANLPEPGRDRQHLVFWPSTPQELEVYKIYGRREGPTIMIMGGIQGDEPGGFLSADLYADLALKRGNLIVVPRVNFKSIIQSHRGPDGDMNRKFSDLQQDDPDQARVEILKELMAESDLLLNLHDGSGYYRPTWESEIANPDRYGQCIIADADTYTLENGRTLPLGDYARQVVDLVNEEISDDLYKFHFFNTDTAADNSKHQEQRKSATYYAVTQLGIPAFGLETSKNLPNLEMKVRQHNLAVNAFMDIFGVELEQPRIQLEMPLLGYALMSVNQGLPIAVADGQTLELKKGDTIEVVHIGANYDRGLSADVLGLGGFNDIRLPLEISAPTTIVVQKDHLKFGRINIGLLPDDYTGVSPRLLGEAKISAPRAGTPVLVAKTKKPDEAKPAAKADTPPLAPPKNGEVLAFLLEIDGHPTELAVGKELTLPVGANIKMVDFKGEGLPKNLVMNLKGFVPSDKTGYNNGEDRGATANTAIDMMPAFSRGGLGRVYDLNAEQGKDIVASASLKILAPKLESVTVTIGGQTRTLKLGARLGIAKGTPVTVEKIQLAEGLPLTAPRFTLGGREFSAALPQTLTMPSFAANLAVFENGQLAGKVLWFPK